MNVENLEVGQIFKNYKEMCEVLGLEVSTSNSKKAQFKELDRHCKFKKDGHKIYIEEVYSKPTPKVETRGNRNGTGVTLLTPLTETNPLLAKQWNTSKNGILTDEITRCTLDEYYWDCDCCNKTILTSPQKRLTPAKGISDDAITCPYCTLSKHAKRIYDLLEVNNINFKQEYTFDDLFGTGKLKRRLRFDFAILDENNSLISFIEYDGGYHDINESTQIHDEIKNKYCQDNNIPLLRIHHSDNKLIEEKTSYFLGLKPSIYIGILKELTDENEDITKQIELLQQKIKDNNKTINEILHNK